MPDKIGYGKKAAKATGKTLKELARMKADKHKPKIPNKRGMDAQLEYDNG